VRIYRCKPETKQDSDVDGAAIPYIASESEYTYHAPTPANNSKYGPHVVIRAYMYHFVRFCYEKKVVLDAYDFVVEDWGIGGTHKALLIPILTSVDTTFHLPVARYGDPSSSLG
jgi:hypothetical protein